VFHVVLFEPEIPPNTGNVIRLCANAGATLHLVKPLGFRLDDKSLRRSGLDYHDLTPVQVHADFAACRTALGGSRLFAVETQGSQTYVAPVYRPDDAFLFGPETRGLPAPLLETIGREQLVSIPMRPGNRSLNLSNAVAVVLYEAWRQTGFAAADRDAPG
jgi:tRNA (cytidine/uridine-2'-O-)-methyltransferase